MRESHRQIDGFARSSSPLHMNKGISDSSPRVVSLRAVLYLPWARINISLLLWDPIFRRGNGLRDMSNKVHFISRGDWWNGGKKSYLWISQWKFMAWLLAAGTVHSKVKDSLVVQWLSIRLPVQGTHVQSLAGEPSKMPRAAGQPVRCSYRARSARRSPRATAETWSSPDKTRQQQSAHVRVRKIPHVFCAFSHVLKQSCCGE